MKRLLSLDIVRGITVAGMILVNNGYTGSFHMLQHAEWNGLSVSDFVFPFFLFIMGVSMFISFSRKGFELTASVTGRIVKRTLMLLAIGLAINWLELAVHGKPLTLSELRFWAVLQRIALCYFIVSIFVLTVNRRYVLPAAISLLIIYTAIIIFGNGYSQDSSVNFLHLADVALFGENHLYHKSVVDPEGLVGTISSLANVLFGFYCGMKIADAANIDRKSLSLHTVGTVLLFCGFIVAFFLPYNKRIWSPSFALTTSGCCAMLLGLCMKWIDADHKSGSVVTFFQVFGINALALYVSSELMAILFGAIGFNDILFKGWSALIPIPQFASLGYALSFVALNFLIGYPLFRRRIYIKL